MLLDAMQSSRTYFLPGQSGLLLVRPEHFLSNLLPRLRTHDCELVDVTRVWTGSVPEYRIAPLKCNGPDHVVSYSGKKDFFLMDLCKKSLSLVPSPTCSVVPSTRATPQYRSV